MVRTNESIHPDSDLYYFEIKVICPGLNNNLSIGLKYGSGFDGPCSVGYHGDNGDQIHNASSQIVKCYKYSTGDTVGCCFKRMRVSGKIYPFCFFTLNGKRMGPTWYTQYGNVFPAIQLPSQGAIVEANLGEKEYVYDLQSK